MKECIDRDCRTPDDDSELWNDDCNYSIYKKYDDEVYLKHNANDDAYVIYKIHEVDEELSAAGDSVTDDGLESKVSFNKQYSELTELMRLMKPYSDIRRDTYYYGVCERSRVSQKEKKKKKAKRRMAKKSKR